MAYTVLAAATCVYLRGGEVVGVGLMKRERERKEDREREREREGGEEGRGERAYQTLGLRVSFW